MTVEPLVAHSLAEAYFYIAAMACQDCDAGPLQGSDGRRTTAEDDELSVSIDVCCRVCGAGKSLLFALPHGLGTDCQPPITNPTANPSSIIDVGQWIMLFRVITGAAAKENNKIEVRRLGLEAAQCLEEALKFYNEDNDLPPSEAFFCESSRRRLQDHPQQFSRGRLLDLRSKLPTMAKMRARLADKDDKRPFWRRWFRSS